MSRQPVDKASALRGAARYWEIIREIGMAMPFTIADILGKTCNANRESVRECLCRWRRGGFLERVGKDERGANVYLLRRDSREAPRLRRDGTELPSTGRDNMWRGMKMLRTFSVADLAATSSTESVPVAAETVREYLLFLTRAGYVARVKTPAGSPALYRLVRNTGPKPPQIQRVKQLWDPNLRKVVWSSGGDA
ncbi:MAG: hypothetical protein AB7E47_12985 [Desulfovibrionaceae bacterium]